MPVITTIIDFYHFYQNYYIKMLECSYFGDESGLYPLPISLDITNNERKINYEKSRRNQM